MVVIAVTELVVVAMHYTDSAAIVVPAFVAPLSDLPLDSSNAFVDSPSVEWTSDVKTVPHSHLLVKLILVLNALPLCKCLALSLILITFNFTAYTPSPFSRTLLLKRVELTQYRVCIV